MFIRVMILAAVAALMAPVAVKAAGDADKGSALYTKSCKVCHGPTGDGVPAMVKMSKGAMHDLKSPEVQKLSDDEMKKKIAGGYGTKKPLKPALTDEQMKEIIAHVRGMAKK